MKLPEALMLRSEMHTKLASLRQRVQSNAVVQDGEQPSEDPRELMAASMGIMGDLTALVVRIHATNHAAKLPDGRGMSAVLAERDERAAQHSLIQAAIAGTSKEVDRYSVREIRWVSMLDVKSLQKQADDVAAKLRALNARVQEANWLIELA